MANIQYYDVILKPVITEKSMQAAMLASREEMTRAVPPEAAAQLAQRLAGHGLRADYAAFAAEGVETAFEHGGADVAGDMLQCVFQVAFVAQ